MAASFYRANNTTVYECSSAHVIALSCKLLGESKDGDALTPQLALCRIKPVPLFHMQKITHTFSSASVAMTSGRQVKCVSVGYLASLSEICRLTKILSVKPQSRVFLRNVLSAIFSRTDKKQSSIAHGLFSSRTRLSLSPSLSLPLSLSIYLALTVCVLACLALHSECCPHAHTHTPPPPTPSNARVRLVRVSFPGSVGVKGKAKSEARFLANAPFG